DGAGKLHVPDGAAVGDRPVPGRSPGLAFPLARHHGSEPRGLTRVAPRLSVIVVSYEVRDLLHDCLASIAAQRGVEVECWVVDNASTDGSAEMVAQQFPAIQLIRNRDNVGFAAANNQALSRARGEVLLLLNPDTALPGGALAELLSVFGRHPAAGCVGLALVDGHGAPQPWCHAFPGLLNQSVEAFGLHRLLLRFGY